MVTRLHNFVLTDAEACCVFMSESMKVAGVDNALKLTRRWKINTALLAVLLVLVAACCIVYVSAPPHP